MREDYLLEKVRWGENDAQAYAGIACKSMLKGRIGRLFNLGVAIVAMLL